MLTIPLAHAACLEPRRALGAVCLHGKHADSLPANPPPPRLSAGRSPPGVPAAPRPAPQAGWASAACLEIHGGAAGRGLSADFTFVHWVPCVGTWGPSVILLWSGCGLGPRGAGGWSVPSTGEKTQAHAACSFLTLSLGSCHPMVGGVSRRRTRQLSHGPGTLTPD